MIGFENISGRRGATLIVAAFAAAFGSTSALAQANCTAAPTPVGNLDFIGAGAAGATGAIASAIGNVNTAFLTQQGSAFVSAPANPAPNQQGGGIWARGVGGEVTLNSTTTSAGVLAPTAGGAPIATTASTCANTQRQDFSGVQVGADIARLNWDGWNIHLGSTAGYLSSRSRDNLAGFRSDIEVPFFGTYMVATYGRFFADVMVRQDYYNVSLNNPGLSFLNQPIGGHGYSISASAGYNFALANNWFIEPSAGFIYSRTKIDDFTSGGSAALPISSNTSFRDISSEIGRVSLRVGTTIATPTMVWQPFGSVSVFHEFAGDVVANSVTFPNAAFVGATPVSYGQTSNTTRVGTYGQYSLGLAGQVVNTGWLGFIRVDYRNGDRIDGWTGNAGLRYQFTPNGPLQALAADLPMKAKAPAAYVEATNWNGLYIGGFFGGNSGRTDISLAGGPDSRPWVFGPLGGGQIGYNWQGGSPWVLGVEGDIGAGDIKGARQCGTATGLDATGAPVGFSPAFYTCRDRTDWVATATARVGYASGRTLYYVRGGGAWEDASTTANCIYGPTATTATGIPVCRNAAGAAVSTFGTEHTRSGWLVGFGTEFDLGRGWSAKTEYNYIDFGRHTALASDGATVISDRASTSQVKVGVNYRFGGPVVARY
jgi:opacity protein-like surface antigen